MMFSKIKKYFRDMNNEILRTKELVAFTRKDVAIIREDLGSLIKTNSMRSDNIHKSLAEISKTLSSIEMELLLQRGASLDNNFEGKQDL